MNPDLVNSHRATELVINTLPDGGWWDCETDCLHRQTNNRLIDVEKPAPPDLHYATIVRTLPRLSCQRRLEWKQTDRRAIMKKGWNASLRAKQSTYPNGLMASTVFGQQLALCKLKQAERPMTTMETNTTSAKTIEAGLTAFNAPGGFFSMILCYSMENEDQLDVKIEQNTAIMYWHCIEKD